MHFRGPIQLKQFAVYMPGSPSAKAKRDAHVRRHAHAHAGHMHHARAPEPQAGAIVTATINGEVVSWTNEYTGMSSTAAPGAPAAASSAPAANDDAAAPASSSQSSEPSSSSAAPAAASASSAGGSISSSSGGWGRQAYYNSASGSQGLVFLNHNGGSGSGVFDYTFGNSLSYASADGTEGSANPTTLSDTTLPSEAEVVIMSDNECSGDDCGYTRNGTVAYHGFDGPAKAFFFEFQMPQVGGTAANQWDPVNMPAVWMLNAQIPRTLQYGNASCSCWTSGCGELDLFEVLAPGDTRMKSTLHGNIGGGDSDYIDRPCDATQKYAVILYNNNVHIKVLDADTDFGEEMDSGTLNDICGSTLEQTNTVSLFNLAS